MHQRRANGLKKRKVFFHRSSALWVLMLLLSKHLPPAFCLTVLRAYWHSEDVIGSAVRTTRSEVVRHHVAISPSPLGGTSTQGQVGGPMRTGCSDSSRHCVWLGRPCGMAICPSHRRCCCIGGQGGGQVGAVGNSYVRAICPSYPGSLCDRGQGGGRGVSVLGAWDYLCLNNSSNVSPYPPSGG